MRTKGFMLIEMLAMFTVMVVILFIFAGQFQTVVSDIPRTHRDFQSNVSVRHMLNRLQADIESANKLSFFKVNDNIYHDTVLIESDSVTIVYVFGADQVTKSEMAEGEYLQKDVWPVPHAVIKTDIWTRNDTGYALELQTGIERTVLGKNEKKLKNSFVYFVGLESKQVH